ncbi:hypothetical protein EGW08_002974 [Elysia chlorotica]|uniref:Integrase catalytic domain-containing protein n=1 Tax=Elysia chlorotica TaxID=188477 RepID=A0A3S1CCU9_ELYCH|nr:hypothetical protein EGW08_002974 [Elysia chlorotica]
MLFWTRKKRDLVMCEFYILSILLSLETAQPKEEPPVTEDSGRRASGDKLVCQATEDPAPNGSVPVLTACPFSSSSEGAPSEHQDQRRRSLLVTEESTCQGGANEANPPKEALHTGKNEFSLISQESLELKNIAVEKNEAKAVNGDALPGDSRPTAVNGGIQPSDLSVSEVIASDTGTQNGCSSEVTATLACEDAAGNSVEEGEIIEDSNSSEKECVRTAFPQQESNGVHSAVSASAPDVQAKAQSQGAGELSKSEQENGETSAPGNSHVVREEEGDSSRDQSELVTSNSNSLASLKRKLESLRHKHGGKLRRLEHRALPSAVGWPVENNVAVSAVQFDHANPAVNACSNETLKANAAAIKIKCAEERARESLLDNGPQLVSTEFKTFLEEWGIIHKTSDPRYPKANGKAESAVKTIKGMLSKCEETGEDPYQALLELRCTPRQDVNMSPAEILLGRRPRTMIPSKAGHRPTPNPSYEALRKRRRESIKETYNKNAKDLPSISIDTPVYFRDPQNKWCPGKVTNMRGRSYMVLSESGGTYVRNRVHLRLKKTPFDDTFEAVLATPDRNMETQQPSQPNTDTDRRPTRAKKPPIWHRDYVTEPKM